MVNIVWKGSPNYHAQSGVSKDFITLHWMVGTLNSTDAVFSSTARSASSTYGVGETEIHQYVNEKDYPFSDGNTYANQHTISIEHEGGWMQADGTRKIPSANVLELSAQLCADIARRHGWGALKWMENVFPHSHWVATQCPGTLDYVTIINRANQLLGSEVAVVPAGGGAAPVPAPSKGYNASSWTTLAIQAGLVKLGYNLGASGADGVYGPATTAAVRKFEVDQGLSVDIGIAGPQVVAKLNQLLIAQAKPTPAPAATGGNIISKAQAALKANFPLYAGKLVVDGINGPLTIAAVKEFQRRAGLVVDGVVGPQTRAKLGI